MDLSLIKRLIKLVERSQIEELEIQEEGLQVRITKSRYTATPPAVFTAQQAVAAIDPVTVSRSAVPTSEFDPEGNTESLIEIKAPMVGTFYSAPSPDTEPYVKVGDQIEPGRILCIVEAMKLMNEIESEISGKIAKIMVENAQPVEYGQVLFLVEKV